MPAGLPHIHQAAYGATQSIRGIHSQGGDGGSDPAKVLVTSLNPTLWLFLPWICPPPNPPALPPALLNPLCWPPYASLTWVLQAWEVALPETSPKHYMAHLHHS